MTPTQQDIIRTLGVVPHIDVAQQIALRVDFLQHHVTQAQKTGLLIAVSGGVDSAVAAALCFRATQALCAQTGQDYRTIALFMPYGEQSDIEDSRAVVRALGIDHAIEMHIQEAVDEVATECEYALKRLGSPRHLSRLAKGNTKARMRMVMQYALAQELNVLVVGTDHASEAITGFYTKYGDGAVDLTPLSSLNKRQVVLLAEALGVPHHVCTKAPTAGLWPGQTDEDELGITYAQNSDYLEGKLIDPLIASTLERMYVATAHKRNPIPGI
jgi:NAD+ synthase